VNHGKTKETSAHIFIPHERMIVLVFQHEEWLVGGDHLYLKFWTKLTLLEQKHRFSIDICLYRLSHDTIQYRFWAYTPVDIRPRPLLVHP